MSVRPGDIVRVPYPYSPENRSRFRPALVVSKPQGPRASLAWVMMVTSSARGRWPGDLEIDYRSAGLPVPSLVRSARIATVETGMIIPLGRVSAGELAAIRGRLRAAFTA
ncbi:MAG: type II toxin-antitoxin system PemK/MazF family toxin [Pacificimonas sp.]|jgi:mRNA interferase MazF|nr:type II toxin-antitoxin system PemK/MazF family toxin [Pacificimonas sp.]